MFLPQLIKFFIYNIITVLAFSTINANSKCYNYFNSVGKMPKYTNFSKFNYAGTVANINYNLKLIQNGEFNNFNPYSKVGITPKDYTTLFFDSLMFTPLDDINTMYPLIATKICITTNSQNKILTVHINPQAQWHNGTPITAVDVKFTIQTLKNKSIAYYNQLLQNVTNITINNNLSLSFTIKNNASFNNVVQTILSNAIISKKYWQNINFTKPLYKVPIGSGAYFIKIINKNTIQYTKNFNYWAKNLPSKKNLFTVSKVTITYTQNKTAYSNTTADFFTLTPTQGVNSAYIKFLQKHNFKIIQTKNVFYAPFTAMFFNTQSSVFKNINLRQAVLQLYNFSNINYNIYNNKFVWQSNLFTQQYSTANFFNKTKAIQLIKQSLPSKPITIVFKNYNKVMLSWLLNLQQAGFKINVVVANNYLYNQYIKNKNYDIIEGSLLFANPPNNQILQYFTSPAQNFYNLNNININLNVNSTNLNKINSSLFNLYLFVPLPVSQYLYYAIKTNLNLNAYAIKHNIINIYGLTNQ